MSDKESNFTIWGFIKGFGKLIIGLLLLIQGVVGLFVMLLIVSVMVAAMNGQAGNAKKVAMDVPDGAALVLNPNGILVEKAEEVDPFEELIEEAYGIDEPGQIEVHDVVAALRSAKDDDRIKGLVLDLGGLQVSSYGASKIHYIADELKKFKESGKPVIAIGDFYSQDQYFLAANADEIYMNDYGNVVIFGYGRYSTFIKSFLEKLKITSHVFRVGTFKSAVEPYMRDDMSPEAKEANLAFLNVLWREYVSGVEAARGLDQGTIENYANDLNGVLRAANGDFAAAAVNTGLVDELKSRAETQELLVEKFGKAKEGESFKRVSFRRYLSAIEKPEDGKAPNVAVVTAAGVIVDGEAPAGRASGGDSVAKLLKKARRDENVKAVVLRVDSPGGSAFASDIIRDEVLAIKKAGKPVVVSMGSLAASGGYWISANADEIWAAPTTITGSIGIFGYFNTFEQLASDWGVYVDGVGTTTLADGMTAGIGPLPDNIADLIQQSIENGYDRFLTIVSEGRGITKQEVDNVGQGRVWVGETAPSLKLVDKLGSFDDAIAAAAARAELTEYDVVEMDEELTPFEQFLNSLSAKAIAMSGVKESTTVQRQSVVQKIVKQVEDQAEFYEEFNDPNAAYARCLACE